MKRNGCYLFLWVSACNKKNVITGVLLSNCLSILSPLKLGSLVEQSILAPQVEGLASTSWIWLPVKGDDKLSFCPKFLI